MNPDSLKDKENFTPLTASRVTFRNDQPESKALLGSRILCHFQKECLEWTVACCMLSTNALRTGFLHSVALKSGFIMHWNQNDLLCH